MFPAATQWALAICLLASTTVLCKVLPEPDTCAYHHFEDGNLLRVKSANPNGDYRAAADSSWATAYHSVEKRPPNKHHHGQPPKPYTPFTWNVTTTKVVVSATLNITVTIATNTTRCRGETITSRFNTTRVSSLTWNSTITEEYYNRINPHSNITIITVTDMLWAENLEETQITETFFSDQEDKHHERRNATWGSQRSNFFGNGSIPCEAMAWRQTIGYRGPVYGAMPAIVCQTLIYIVNNNDTGATHIPDQMETNRVDYSRRPVAGGIATTATTPCYEPFGCFPNTAPWSTEDREFPFIPEPPSKIKTGFCLRTRQNPERCQFLDAVNHTTIYESYFDAHNRTFFVVHGFLESMNRPWLHRISAELLKMEECNVVIVDWQGGSTFPYAQAVANIRVVGVMMGYLIRDMIREVGLRPSMVHIIGHSLGAHAASYAGSTLYQKFGFKIGRITALDAAEPRFANTDPLVRLDPTDAMFVDVIHTDASPFITGGLGIREPIGHVDFYPNGGKDQPGCAEGISNFITEKNGNVLRGIEKYLNCNHVRSNEYFIESINGPCKFFGVQCSSWEAYKNGSCFSCSHGSGKGRSGSRLGPHCARMGMHILESVDLPQISRNKRPMRMFLTTGAEAPFCRSQYRVTLTISNSTKSKTHGGEVGIISVAIKGSTGATAKMQLYDRERYHGPGSTHRSTVIGECVGTMTSATLSLDYRTSMLNPLTWRLVVMPRIYVASVTIDSLEEADSMTISLPETAAIVYKRPLECQRSTDKGAGECVPKMSNTFLKSSNQ